MTVVVVFNCVDGVVIAADSMITPSIGGINVGHHHGRKIEVLAGPQLFAFAGDQGQGARFRVMAEFEQGCYRDRRTPFGLWSRAFSSHNSAVHGYRHKWLHRHQYGIGLRAFRGSSVLYVRGDPSASPFGRTPLLRRPWIGEAIGRSLPSFSCRRVLPKWASNCSRRRFPGNLGSAARNRYESRRRRGTNKDRHVRRDTWRRISGAIPS